MEYKNNLVHLFNNAEDKSLKFITYFPAGDTIIDSIKLADIYLENGSDVLEIGLPVKHPYLDGSTVSDSMKRARESHTIGECLNIIKTIRKNHPDSALEIMCYKQLFDELPLEQFNAFAEEAKIDALLVADATNDENLELKKKLAKRVSLLHFMNYNYTDEDVSYLEKNGDGFIFLQAVNGSTGAREKLDAHLAEKVKDAKARIDSAAICPGFGISTPEHCRQVAKMGADGLIIGSEVIKKTIEGEDALKQFLRDCKEAMSI
jgi:tryptophan synthase alpha chain